MIIAHLLTGPLMLVISYLYIKQPPKKVNALYGYRTSFSMKNEETWKEGNRYNAQFLFKLSLGICTVQIIGYLLLDSGFDILTAVVFLVAGLLYSIRKTEKHLHSVFDKEGKRL
tara:strand:+ start:1491 stop:1832 length:342 start_codon:yes stop_codon:yes gene_type:complete